MTLVHSLSLKNKRCDVIPENKCFQGSVSVCIWILMISAIMFQSSLLDCSQVEKASHRKKDVISKYTKKREVLAEPDFEVYKYTDRYGFIHDYPLPEFPDRAEVKSCAKELKRVKKWLKMLENWDQYYPRDKFVKRIYKGIPDRLRGQVWAGLLNTKDVMDANPGLYEKLKEQIIEKSTYIEQIDLDVIRTFRKNIMFKEENTTKQQELFHILAAFSVYNPELGYCQGMNEIVATLLMYQNEEEAFWSLSQLVLDEKHSLHGFFIPGFPKLFRFLEYHDVILEKMLPKTKKHLDKNEVYSAQYTIKWFLQCFLGKMPFHLTLRLWDIWMFEGDSTLTGMAYCIIKIHQRHIKKKLADEILLFLHTLENNFRFNDDLVINKLKICMKELKSIKMELPTLTKENERPTFLFGLDIPSTTDTTAGIHRHKRMYDVKESSSYSKTAHLSTSDLQSNLCSTERSSEKTDCSNMSPLTYSSSPALNRSEQHLDDDIS